MNAYIIHVSDATEREKHINSQLKGKNLEAVFVCEGDKKDISKTILETYFSGEMAKVNATVSCAYKHLLAYNKMLENNNKIALVLEDDIYFYDNFEIILEELLHEIKHRNLDNFLLSIEDSTLTYVPNSKRKKGTLIYSAKSGRTAGAYLIDRKAAENILLNARNNKIDLPIDWFHNLCTDQKKINMYWSHPAVACQGSLDGSIPSLIDDKKFGFLKIWSFKVQKVHKQFLYWLW